MEAALKVSKKYDEQVKADKAAYDSRCDILQKEFIKKHEENLVEKAKGIIIINILISIIIINIITLII